MDVVIIDNEENIREGLKELIANFCPDLNLIGEANGVESGIELLESLNPEIVFLDVEMDDGTGMDLLSKIEVQNFAVIFVTAHDKYAVNAFQFSAIDFILKPVDPEDLVNAVEKATHQIKNENVSEQLKILSENIKTTNKSDKKIVLKDAESMHFVNVSDVLFCMADGSYTTFQLVSGEKIMVSKNLKEYEKLLSSNNFFRTHHSYLANLDRVVRFDKLDGGTLILEGNFELPVSFRKKDSLIEKLNSL